MLTILFFSDYFLNLLLNPTSPTRPEPRSSIVEGSGMEAGAAGAVLRSNKVKFG
jgi:hypothetical protein